MSLFQSTVMPDLKEPSDTTGVRKMGLDLLAKINKVWDGVVSNGIYDTGSNTNGSWIRWNNGVMMCWGTTGLLGDNATISFPVAFSSAPSVVATANQNNNITTDVYNITISDFVVRSLIANTAGAISSIRCWHALGRWK